MLAIGGWAQEQKGEHGHPMGTPPHEHPKAPVRITMEELHRHGGVPPGWRFTVPEGDPQAGREVFVKLECFKVPRGEGRALPQRAQTGDRHGARADRNGEPPSLGVLRRVDIEP